MNITIRINTDSTAFEGRERWELSIILARYANDLSRMTAGEFINRPLHDSNGQVCGSVEISEQPDIHRPLTEEEEYYLYQKDGDPDYNDGSVEVQESEVK